ncbi:hypothetical protein AVEN_180335-1, partial [Araneus ventricosus]
MVAVFAWLCGGSDCIHPPCIHPTGLITFEVIDIRATCHVRFSPSMLIIL